MSASTIRTRGRVIALAAFVLTATAACTAGSAGTARTTGPAALSPAASAPTSDAATTPSIQEILANVRAARGRHDNRSLAQLRAQLTSRVGETTIQSGLAAYRDALANFRAAGTVHDGRARAGFRAQLVALCDVGSPVSAFENCEVDLASAAS